MMASSVTFRSSYYEQDVPKRSYPRPTLHKGGRSITSEPYTGALEA